MSEFAFKPQAPYIKWLIICLVPVCLFIGGGLAYWNVQRGINKDKEVIALKEMEKILQAKIVDKEDDGEIQGAYEQLEWLENEDTDLAHLFE
jgi:hypothetical protein